MVCRCEYAEGAVQMDDWVSENLYYVLYRVQQGIRCLCLVIAYNNQ